MNLTSVQIYFWTLRDMCSLFRRFRDNRVKQSTSMVCEEARLGIQRRAHAVEAMLTASFNKVE